MEQEIIRNWKDANDIGPCYEGMAGLMKFEQLLETIGYMDSSFGERSIVSFLENNPGAIESLEDWIEDQENKDWEYELIAATPYSEVKEKEEDETYVESPD